MWERFQKFPVLIANNGKKSQCLTPAKVINEIILSMRNGFWGYCSIYILHEHVLLVSYKTLYIRKKSMSDLPYISVLLLKHF